MLFTKGKTVEKGDDIFFRPTDLIWGLYGIRAKKAGVNAYHKNSLFLEVSYMGNPGVVSEKTSDLKARITDLDQKDAIGWAFTIVGIKKPMSLYIANEIQDSGDGEFIVCFQISVELITTQTVTDLLNRPDKDEQLGPILVLDKATIRAYEPAEMVVRIGQYPDGRYVLFLHGKIHETDHPVRIPSE